MMQRSGSTSRLLTARKPWTAGLLTIGFQVEELERFLTVLRPMLLMTEQDLALACSEFAGLAIRWKTKGKQGCFDELSSVADVLSSVLNALPSLPPILIFQVHYFTGQICEAQMRYQRAAGSYMKALWIASSSDFPKELLALTLHRLGKVSALNGSFEQSKTLLEKAQSAYKEAHLSKDHPCMAEVARLLGDCQVRSATKGSAGRVAHQRGRFGSLRSMRKLALIPEESDLVGGRDRTHSSHF